MRSAAAFVQSHTRVRATPFVPEVRLHVAEDIIELWERSSTALGDNRTRGPSVDSRDGRKAPGLDPRDHVAPPFWGFPWAGGQALARHVLDHPDLVAGRRVLDLASGSGLVAVAAALAGAAQVTANDVDPCATAAIELNARTNGVQVRTRLGDLLADAPGGAHDVVLAGDVCFSRQLAERVLPWLAVAAERGALVLLGDPGRAYAPREGYAVVAVYDIPVAASLEDAGMKHTSVLTPLTGLRP